MSTIGARVVLHCSRARQAMIDARVVLQYSLVWHAMIYARVVLQYSLVRHAFFRCECNCRPLVSLPTCRARAVPLFTHRVKTTSVGYAVHSPHTLNSSNTLCGSHALLNSSDTLCGLTHTAQLVASCCRGAEFTAIITGAEERLRKLLHVPATHRVLFTQGGGTGQFSAVPLNLFGGAGHAGEPPSADYIVTGSWSATAAAEAAKYGHVNEVCNVDPLHCAQAMQAYMVVSFSPDG